MADLTLSLSQSNLSVLSDLNKVCTDEIVERVLENLEGTAISSYVEVYSHALEFKKKTGKFPDRDYLQERYPSSCGFGDRQMSPTADTVLLFLSDLKKEHLLYLASEGVINGNFDVLENVLSEYKTSRIKKVNYSFSTVAENYKAKKYIGPGVNTGVPDIDELTAGLGYGTLTTLAGGSGHGKTTLARSIAYNIAYNEPKNVVFITMEISRDDMKAVFLSRHSKSMGKPLAGRDIIKCMLEPEYKPNSPSHLKKNVEAQVERNQKRLAQIADDFERNSKGKIYIVEEADFPDWSISGFRAYLEKLDDEIVEETGHGIDVVILDYIQLVKPSGMKGSMDLKEYRNLFIQGFRSMCVSFRERQLVGIILSQINRTGMKSMDGKADKPGGKISASYQDLAELNSIERESSVIIVVYSNHISRSGNLMYVQIIKNRLGTLTESMVPVTADFKHNSVGNNVCLKAEVINDKVLDSDLLGDDFDDNLSLEEVFNGDDSKTEGDPSQQDKN